MRPTTQKEFVERKIQRVKEHITLAKKKLKRLEGNLKVLNKKKLS